MVIARIAGGLGNQMFQYAFGRALAIARNTQLVLDLDEFQGHPLHREFELSRVFDIAASEAGGKDLRRVLGWRGRAAVRRMLLRQRFAWLRGQRILVEPHFEFWREAIEVAPRDCLVSGYWQSEKYFVAVQDVIRREFTFKQPLESVNADLQARIRSSEAISVHVRRGDYISNRLTNRTHGVCSLEYYARALEIVAEHCKRPVAYVFSDDVEWVKGNLRMPVPHQYVVHNRGAESYNDMRLMSQCQHHIIANSSFSWWGAWLNGSTRKLVVAPRKWFGLERGTEDLIPSGWIRT